MNKLFYAFTEPQFRKRSLLFIAIAIVLLIISSIVPVNNNGPGLKLMFIAAGFLVISFIHPWQKPKQYLILAVYIVLVFVISVILHNVLEIVSERYIPNELLSGFVNAISVLFFLVAVVLCPPAFLIAIAGSVYLFIRNRFFKPNN